MRHPFNRHGGCGGRANWPSRSASIRATSAPVCASYRPTRIALQRRWSCSFSSRHIRDTRRRLTSNARRYLAFSTACARNVHGFAIGKLAEMLSTTFDAVSHISSNCSTSAFGEIQYCRTWSPAELFVRICPDGRLFRGFHSTAPAIKGCNPFEVVSERPDKAAGRWERPLVVLAAASVDGAFLRRREWWRRKPRRYL